MPVDRIAYLHSFALTERYAVIVEGPFMLRPSDLLVADKPLLEKYRWEPDRGTRFIVIDRARGRHVATLRGDPFFTFHVINAHDNGSRLTIDLAAYEDSSIFDAMYLPRLRGQTSRPFGFDLDTRRCTLDLSANKVRTHRIGPGLEFPRIDYSRLHTRPYRYVYGASLRDKQTSGWFDQIGKLDTTTGRVMIWRERGCYPGEAFFVPTPGTTREDGGVLLSVVVDGRTRTSFLLVLDARHLGGGRPRAGSPPHPVRSARRVLLLVTHARTPRPVVKSHVSHRFRFAARCNSLGRRAEHCRLGRIRAATDTRSEPRRHCSLT